MNKCSPCKGWHQSVYTLFLLSGIGHWKENSGILKSNRDFKSFAHILEQSFFQCFQPRNCPSWLMNMQGKGWRGNPIFLFDLYSLSTSIKNLASIGTQNPTRQSRPKTNGRGVGMMLLGWGWGWGPAQNSLLVFRLWAKLFMQILNK